MANTFTSLHYHVVFSTKNREPWLRQEHEKRIWAYLAGIAMQHDIKPLLIGGFDDHIHLLVGLPASMPLSAAVKTIKGVSSGWIKAEIPGCNSFSWQDGYSAFSVSNLQISVVKAYIQSQREHHRIKSFQEEYVSFLNKHGIAYDVRYLWG